MENEKDLTENTEENLEENTETSAEETAVQEVEKAAEDTPGDAPDDDNEDDADSAFGNKLANDIIEIVESTLITVFVIVMIFTYILHPVNVSGHSMEPTLYDNDKIFMTTVYFGLDYGDIIVIDNNASYLIDENGDPYKPDQTNNPLNECIIKRVIATEGQEINIDDSDPDPDNWTVTVDGKVLSEPYIAKNAHTDSRGGFSGQYPFKVPEGYCFVMGDNREQSSDSRNAYVGLVKLDQIYGKAIVRYSPFKDFKTLWDSYKKSSEAK